MKDSKKLHIIAKSTILIIIFLLISASFLEQQSSTIFFASHTEVIVMNNVGSVRQIIVHSNIQAAINEANDGDAIIVSSGIYYEQIILNKSISIRGENLETELISNSSTDIIVTIEASNVTVSNFSIKNGNTGIYVINSTNCNIHGVDISGNRYGIFGYHSTNVHISNNTIHDNQVYGIVFLECVSVVAEKNVVRKNEYGVHLHGCKGPSNIIENEVTESFAHGIFLDYTTSTFIRRNTILETAWYALSLFSSLQNIVLENSIAHNYCGIYLKNSTDNNIYLNDFVNNTYHLYYPTLIGNNWDDGKKGNYWDDYEGIDTNGDPVGDTLTPHLQIDYYPIIRPLHPIPFQLEAEIFLVYINSNYTVLIPTLNRLDKQISFDINGPAETKAFIVIAIPKSMLQGKPWEVVIDNNRIESFELEDNQTYTTIYVDSLLSGRQYVEIRGTWVISEFSALSAILFFISSSLVSLLKRKRRMQF